MPLYCINGKSPSLSKTAWIAPSADVIGDARLSENVSVWFGAVIRADNTPIEIGTRTNIQDGAILHSDPGSPLTVGRDVTVGHHAILHGCTVGNRVLIGMGACILNNAVIGENSLVAAGALVTPGKSYPPGSLIVGVPAKVLRPLSETEIENLLESAEAYARKRADYSTSLAIHR